MSNVISFSNIKKSYGNQTVLNDINLSIDEGDFVGLVGVNGAGKTTLIKSMLDFTDIDSGQIEIKGIEHLKVEARETLAYLPERFNPPAYLTGHQFIQYMIELHRMIYEKNEVVQLLKALGFDVEQLSKYVHQYSKGMVQKLGLASAFLSRKSLLILDEPMSGLDPKARKHVKEYFLRLKENTKQKSTLFISTHLLVDAASICDKLIVLHDAHICFEGTPTEFLHQFGGNDYDVAFVNCISVVDANPTL